MTLKKICLSLAPRLSADRISVGLTDRSPSSVLVNTGMNVVHAIKRILGNSPIPSQMMKIGSSAKAGIGPSKFKIGLSQ